MGIQSGVGEPQQIIHMAVQAGQLLGDGIERPLSFGTLELSEHLPTVNLKRSFLRQLIISVF